MFVGYKRRASLSKYLMSKRSNSTYVPSENGEGTGNNQDPTTPEVIPLVNDNNTEALTPPVVQDDSAGDVHRTSLHGSAERLNETVGD